MQKLTIRLLTAVLTFFIGLIATTIWWGQRTTTVERIAMRTKIACQWPQTNNADDIYVPADAFLPDESRENRLVKPYSALLTAMDEPSLLSTMSDEYEAYRIVWLRPFHPKVVVRVWKAGSESCLSVKKFDGQGEYVHGETVYLQRFQNETRPLREVEWEGFTEHPNLGHFWSMPTVVEGAMSDDGALVMEGVRDRKYHVVDRQSSVSGPYREMCNHLLRLSRLNLE